MNGFTTKAPLFSGNALLYCGDCLSEMGRVESGAVQCVIADPPYGARRPSARRMASDRFDEVVNNEAVHAEWIPEAFRVLADGGALYVFVCWDVMHQWRKELKRAGFRVRSCIIWDKVVHGLADLVTCWAPQYEMILFAAKGRHELKGKRPKDIVRVQRVDPTALRHPYEKPVDLLTRLVKASTVEGETVLDPFMGSGTTGVAAIQTGRNFIGIELDEGIFTAAEKRIKGTPRRAR